MPRDQKRGMAKPFEQDVILDADGRSLFSAVELFERKIEKIGKTIKDIERDSYKTASDLNKTLEVNLKALQKAQQQLNTLQRVGASARTQERTVAGRTAATDVSRYGLEATKAKYLLELEDRLRTLQYARTESDRKNGIEAVRTAQARVRAVEQIEAAEKRISVEQLRRQRTDNMSNYRAQVALARSYADEQIRTLGIEEAVRVAKGRQLVAEERLRNATAQTRNELRENLMLENARLRAMERLAAQRRREAAQQGGGGGGRGGGNGPFPGGGSEGNPLGSILSPGYAAAAFARTSVYGLAAIAAYGAFNTVQESVTALVQLDDELAKLQAIAGATDQQMTSLKKTILEVGTNSRFSVNELAKITQVLAQAGISVGDMENVLRSVTTLATASGSTPDEAVQLVTSALGAFQLQGSEAARVADLMTEALNRTKLTVQQTGQAIQYVGATAYEQNISLEQLLATIGAIAQAGVKSGSTIGTGFRQFLVDLSNPSKDLRENLEALGLKASDVDVRVRGLPAVLETLRDAGFGAAQAYDGLEVRAAAFYLTAKNNIDIIDRLQLAFSQQSAAANANEKAMSSLSAQWQEFKNRLTEAADEKTSGFLALLKSGLSAINDQLERNNQLGREQSGIEKAAQYANVTPWGMLSNTLSLLNEAYRDTSVSAEDLTTKISNQNDKIETQRGRLSELDKELTRLIVQKESLRDNEVRTAAETANLSGKFEGLALNLRGTGNAYDDLVAAMKRYKYAQIGLLNNDLLAQEANLVLQNAQTQGNIKTNAQNLLRDSAFLNSLGGSRSQVQTAIATVATSQPGTRAYNNAQAILVDAINRLVSINEESAKKLGKLVEGVGTVSYNTAQIESLRLESGNNRAAQSPRGQEILNRSKEVEAIIQQLGSLQNSDPEKRQLTSQAYKLIQDNMSLINRLLPTSNTDWGQRFLKEAATTMNSLRKQVDSANRVTDEEKRESARADREAKKGPLLTQADLDRLAKEFLGSGFMLGSGVRSAAEQNALYRAGKTPATAAGSSHSNGGLARDFKIAANVSNEQAKQLATALRNYFKNLGLDVFVQFESGQGKNQGTGRHIHVSARKGTRYKGSDGGSDAAAMDQFNAAMDTAQLGLDKRELTEAMKDLANATTQEALMAAVSRSKNAMEQVRKDLREKAMNELSKAGVGPGFPQYQERMNQLEEEIAQMNAEFQRRLVDALVKGTQKTFEATIKAYERTLVDSQRPVQLAEASSRGLNYASISSNVPDYVKQMADRRTAQAQEAADRAKLDALPGVIADLQQQIANLSASMMANIMTGSLTDPEEIQRVKDQIQGLTDKLNELRMTKEELQAAFSAGGLIPTNFTDGLRSALQAFNELNGANRSFVEQVNGELGGAISQLHGGLSTLFSTVLTDASSAGSAALAFGRMIVQMITQIVAKIIATKIIELLGQLVGSFTGGPVGGSSSSSGGAGFVGPREFHGGPIRRMQGGPTGYSVGGHINRGHNMRDNVMAMLSKGEWVINRRAVDSVGHEFMADLNARGRMAVDNMRGNGPSLNVNPKQEVNVWMVKPDQKPQLGPQDVLVVWQDDVLNGGQSRKLIESISRESNR